MRDPCQCIDFHQNIALTAYSLLGIFGVQMPLLYGEGAKNGNFRLRRAIAKKWQRQCLGRL
jgi:hypothetical protein